MTLVGIWVDGRNPAPWSRSRHYGRILETIEEAERLGLDSVQLSEHHFFEDGYLPQPLTFGAAIAARTSRLRIGTSILVPALRQPLHLAEEAAIVDQISNGRLDLGLGVGWCRAEFQATGQDYRHRYRLFEERVVALQQLWSGACTPKPVQDPIPLWGGVNGPRGARLVGRLGMGLQTLRAGTAWEQYLQGLAEAAPPRPEARVAGGLFAMLADDPDAAFERLRPHIEHMWRTYGQARDPAAETVTADESRRLGPTRPPGFDVVTPHQAAQLVTSLAEGRDITAVWLWSSIAGAPDDLVARNLELLATEFRTALSSTKENQ
jgi:alkanesulfonate monooxygenase SsuD/methylene tetrahydromethanopterin reductase-like flavin-dependent oxidoreductase (luciferase family)